MGNAKKILDYGRPTMSELDQTKIDKNFKDLSSNTRCIIDINNCSIEEIVRKIEFDS